MGALVTVRRLDPCTAKSDRAIADLLDAETATWRIYGDVVHCQVGPDGLIATVVAPRSDRQAAALWGALDRASARRTHQPVRDQDDGR